MQSFFRHLAAMAALAVLPSVASAQTANPPARIYQFTGVYQDSATANQGTATVFTCTNFSNTAVFIGLIIRQDTGTVVHDNGNYLDPKETYSFLTKQTVAHVGWVAGVPGQVRNGSAAISSTELEVRCVAEVVSASATQPTGYRLPHARYFQTQGAAE